MPIAAYIALGANTGDRRANIVAALQRLMGTPGVELRKVSPMLENPAVGGPDGSPDFFNAAAEIETALAPRDLLGRLLEIERELGRKRRTKWEPRPIDLDILLYGEQVIDADDLKIPHPLMHERDFVLKPLEQIAPHARHPKFRATIAELRRANDRRRNLLKVAFVISDDLSCPGCEYNLRGLRSNGNCPECGKPIADAITGELQRRPEFAVDMRRAQLMPLAENAGCTIDGLLFVIDAAGRALTEARRQSPPHGETPMHLDARALCAGVKRYANSYFNDRVEAADLLNEWGVHDSETVGRIVFALAGAGMLTVGDSDRESDFVGLFTLETLFEK